VKERRRWEAGWGSWAQVSLELGTEGREGEVAQRYERGRDTQVPGMRRRVARGEGAVESSRGGEGAREGSHARDPESAHLGPLSHPRRWLMARLGLRVRRCSLQASSSHGAEHLRSGQSGNAGSAEAARGSHTAAGLPARQLLPRVPPRQGSTRPLSPSERGGP